MQLLVGWATQDITPEKPVELIGQYYQRISRRVRDPLSVTALALEQSAGGVRSQSVFVSVDTLFVTRDFQDEVRARLRRRVADLDPRHVTLNATHIHSGPSWFAPFRWWKPAANALQPAEIRAFMLERVVAAAAAAWQARQPAGASSASVFASVGFCRRTLHADGRAEMYGDPAREDFVGIEAGSDDEVRLLFTWDRDRRLSGVVVNVACPAQVMEAEYDISADFFGELRRLIQARHGAHVQLLAQVSAAGDLSPRNLPTQARDEINYWKESGVRAIAARLAHAVDEGHAAARGRIDFAAVLRHRVEELSLPIRRVTRAECEQARAEVRRLAARFADEDTASRELYADFVVDVARGEARRPHGPYDDKSLDFVLLENAQAVVARFASQERTPSLPLELHAIRVGECAFILNPFELYVDFGHMLRARSVAGRTFVVELACDAAGYLPTARAAAAGGYGSLVINGKVGPDGGTALAAASVKAIAALWA